MNKIVMLVSLIVACSGMQGCATGGSGTTEMQAQSPAVSGNVTGQNMDYMYRSPSYQIGHM